MRGDAHETGQHDARDDQAAGALFRRPRQFLDGEHDPAQRRIEGSRDARRPARDEQAVDADGAAGGDQAARLQHDAGRDLHGRAFAAKRQATQQAAGRQQDLGER
ncbi:hypothetical protein GCM10025794_17190 [Massilia kyonggiensis]